MLIIEDGYTDVMVIRDDQGLGYTDRIHVIQMVTQTVYLPIRELIRSWLPRLYGPGYGHTCYSEVGLTLCLRENALISCANGEDSNQPVHAQSIWRTAKFCALFRYTVKK